MSFWSYCTLPVTFEGTKKILKQMENCICKVFISSDGYGFGTGFFCIIPYKGSELKVLITAYHILHKEYLLHKKEIKIELNNKLKVIDINDNRKIYSNDEFDIAIIEINPYKDKIKDFLELDEDISKVLFTEKEEEILKLIRKNSTVYTLQNAKTFGKAVSYGTILNLEEFTFVHFCSTEKGSTGSPILDLRNNKVIGMHTQYNRNLEKNIGTFLFYPIKDFNDGNNLLIINKEYNDKDFSDIKLIKTGAYGKIYSAYSLQDKEEVCLKRIDIEEMKKNYEENQLKDFQQDLNNEINILKLLSSNENSVMYYGEYDNKNEKINEKIIVMEKCDMNLKEFIIQKKNALSCKEIKDKFLALNKLFKNIQKEKIIHRDLKLENLLIKYNEEKTDYLIKLGDYGLGKFKGKSNGIFSGLKGTPDTVAPEIILEKVNKYESSVDIFSLGIILYQLSHNLKHPFGTKYELVIIKYHENYDKDNLNIEFDNSINNNDFVDLVRKMIKLNPKNRLKWEEYFEHPFFKSK